MSLKSFFIKDDETEKKEVVVAKKTVPEATIPQTLNTSTATNIQSGTDYGKVLDDVLEQGNQPGADFLEFHKALNGLDGKPISEEQKYEFTFPAYQSLGVTAEKLVASANYYLDLLNKEGERFIGEWSEAQSQQVDAKKALMEKIAAENADYAKKIQENTTKSQKLNEEIFTSSNSLNTEKLSFENQLTIKKSVINDRITKIKTYLYASTSK